MKHDFIIHVWYLLFKSCFCFYIRCIRQNMKKNTTNLLSILSRYRCVFIIAFSAHKYGTIQIFKQKIVRQTKKTTSNVQLNNIFESQLKNLKLKKKCKMNNKIKSNNFEVYELWNHLNWIRIIGFLLNHKIVNIYRFQTLELKGIYLNKYALIHHFYNNKITVTSHLRDKLAFTEIHFQNTDVLIQYIQI